MPRLRFHNLNNGTNNRIGSEDITSTALLIFCAVVVLIPVTGIATFTWYMPFAFFSGVLRHRRAIQSRGCGRYRCRSLDRD